MAMKFNIVNKSSSQIVNIHKNGQEITYDCVLVPIRSETWQQEVGP